MYLGLFDLSIDPTPSLATPGGHFSTLPPLAKNSFIFSIGIELEGCDDDVYEEEQYKSLIQVTKALIKEYDLISKKRITGHSDIAPERKTDPGKYFEWNRYLDNV